MAREAAADDKLYKIGEVCKLADVQPYVLRYWETEFPQLAPNKSGGGQRLYTRREIDIILRIKELLYREGFTTAGAKKKLEAEAHEPAQATLLAPPPSDVPPASSAANTELRDALTTVKKELTAILRMLED